MLFVFFVEELLNVSTAVASNGSVSDVAKLGAQLSSAALENEYAGESGPVLGPAEIAALIDAHGWTVMTENNVSLLTHRQTTPLCQWKKPSLRQLKKSESCTNAASYWRFTHVHRSIFYVNYCLLIACVFPFPHLVY